jgi:hypothetical protein
LSTIIKFGSEILSINVLIRVTELIKVFVLLSMGGFRVITRNTTPLSIAHLIASLTPLSFQISGDKESQKTSTDLLAN